MSVKMVFVFWISHLTKEYNMAKIDELGQRTD